MKDFDNYNNEIKKIKLNEIKDKEILNNILNNKNDKKFNIKFACIITLIFVSFIGITYADEITKTWTLIFPVDENIEYVGETNFEFVKTNFDDCDVWNLDIDGNYNTIEEIEDLIGVKVLKLDGATRYSLNTTNKISNDSKVYTLNVVQNFDFNDNTLKSYSLSAKIYTKHAYEFVNKSNAFEFFGGIVIGKNIIEEYYIDSLDTTATIYNFNNNKRTGAVFVYNNIQYEIEIFINDVSKVKSILENLHE